MSSWQLILAKDKGWWNMTHIVNYSYGQDTIAELKNWRYGINWPIVYIIYNNEKVYIGETLDAVRRTGQHLKEEGFAEFTDICLITDKTFNKSVILDLESFLIKYMSAEDSKQLTNGNVGVADHNYFYKEAYTDEFKEIWDRLKKLGIVRKSILDIENSELFKYSPFKSLNEEQQRASYEIMKMLREINNASTQSIIEVTGGAGTGKTILAVYILKLLVDINANKKIWNYIEDYEEADYIRNLSQKINGIKKIGFVVPMIELRTTMHKIFTSIDGLSADMVLAPEQVVNDYYDLLIVDEAHRLYQRKHLPGSHLYIKFDKINEKLMGEKITKSDRDLTELDWIIQSSRIQVLFYDKLQSIRTADIYNERFEEICRPHLYKYLELFSQMRCKGGNGYYDYVKDILFGTNVDLRDFKRIDGYTLRVTNYISELFDLIYDENERTGLCKVVAGPGWSIEEDIEIEGNTYHWAGDRTMWDSVERMRDTVFSIHKSQGFDLNYAGVIFGKEVYYDVDKKRIEINKRELRDSFTKSSGDEAMRQYILNIYLTLMTRGIDGTFIYAVDENLRNYLSNFFTM